MTERSPKVAVFGELNVDLVITGLESMPRVGNEILAEDFQMTLGSASAIFACGLARLDYSITFVSKVGADDLGKFCLAALQQAGIPTDLVRQDPQHATGVTISLSTKTDRALVTHLGVIATLTREQVPLSVLAEHKHLHLTSYFLQYGLRPSFAEIFAAAKQMGLTTSFDPNSDPSQEWSEEIWGALAQTDVLFLNETEALQLTKQRDEEAALQVLKKKVSCAVIKLGAKGAMAARGDEIEWVPAFETDVVDTTGAGDSFDAGFIHAFLQSRSLRSCLTVGNACGALCAMKAGGTTNQPDKKALSEFLKARQVAHV